MGNAVTKGGESSGEFRLEVKSVLTSIGNLKRFLPKL